MTPQRIQLSRRNGWRKPEGAIVVSRPSKWGNPYRIERVDCDAPAGGMCWRVTTERVVMTKHIESEAEAREIAVDMFRHLVETTNWHRNYLTALTGHDLACWCPLDQPCHADVLLEIANSGAS